MNQLSLVFVALLMALPAMAQTLPGGNCSASSLNGTYSLNLNGRAIGTGGAFTGLFDAVGSATFDGKSGVTFTGTYDSIQSANQSFNYSGTYTMPSDCLGTVTLTQGSSATFALTVYSSGRQFDITGKDSTYIYDGGGINYIPVACAAATLSGTYAYQVAGGVPDGADLSTSSELGIFQFDGRGSVTGQYVYNAVETNGSFSGTYTVSPNCQATVTVKDSSTGATNTFNLSIAGTYGEGASLIESGSGKVRIGQTQSTFATPTQSITDAASYVANATPAGSVFALFGLNLTQTTSSMQPGTLPLPTNFQNTTVTVNNEPAPLFYVGTTQIDAQMPWDIPGNALATVVVTNTGANGTTSNAAAVYVPAQATPGVSFFSTNRAAVINQDGSTNDATHPAAVNDEEVLYFTGGGPVTPAGPLVSGAAAPSGLSPVTDPNASLTVGGVAAHMIYVGLTPTAVGLYQANFNVPQLTAGTYPVVITISGQASNTLGGPVPSPVMTVSN